MGFGTSTNTWRTPKRSASSSPRRAHAERLGRVVAGGEEVDARLLRAGHHPLGRLAGQERVEARGDRVLQVVGAAARDDPDRAHRGRGRPGRPAARGRSPRARARRARPPAMPSPAKRARTPIAAPLTAAKGAASCAPELAGQQRVVADLGMAVERQVVGGQRHVGVEERLQARLGGAVERSRRARPEQAVVHEHEVRALLARALRTARRWRTRRSRPSGSPRDRGPAGRSARSRRSRPDAAARTNVQ